MRWMPMKRSKKKRSSAKANLHASYMYINVGVKKLGSS